MSCTAYTRQVAPGLIHLETTKDYLSAVSGNKLCALESVCGESSEAVHVREMFIYLMVLITAEMKVFLKMYNFFEG